MLRAKGVCCAVAMVLVLALVVGCVADGLPEPRLSRRGPADVLDDVIGQVSRLGDAVSRQITRMTRGRW